MPKQRLYHFGIFTVKDTSDDKETENFIRPYTIRNYISVHFTCNKEYIKK